MKKICFLVPGLSAGGIENYLLRFINFINKPSQITVVVRNQEKGDLYEQYKKTGVTLRLQGIGYFNPLKIYKIYSFFRKEKFDTICDFNGNFAGLVVLAARFAGVKKRIVFYRRSSNAFKENFLRLLYNLMMNRLVYRNSTKILSNSEHALKFFFPYKKKDDVRFKVIRNGIDTNIFNTNITKEEARRILNIPEGLFIIGHIGRYDSSKNHTTIFKVIKEITKEITNIKFVFCGKGTDSNKFLNEVKKFGIEDYMISLGLQNDIPLVLKTFDIFYFPSITEGQPNALIEAMISGLPVITSNIPPIKEVIPEHVHKYLVPPLDVDKACRLIKRIIGGSFNLVDLIYKSETSEKFNMRKNFNLFYDELSQ